MASPIYSPNRFSSFIQFAKVLEMVSSNRLVSLVQLKSLFAMGRRIGRSVLVLAMFAMVAACAKPEERAMQHYKKGLDLMAKGDNLNARVELTTATKFKPDMIEAWR